MQEDNRAVTEKAFDEFHLYSLARPTTPARDRETKQVEFVRATDVKAPTIYVYDGAESGYRFLWRVEQRPWLRHAVQQKVRVMREFVNAETNHLGIALPKGKLRFYRRDADGQMEFRGRGHDRSHAAQRNHPRDHRQTPSTSWATQADQFPRGHRRQVAGRIVRDQTAQPQNRSRWNSAWSNISTAGTTGKITAKSDDFKKTDAQTIEFRVPVKPDEERMVTYTVHYSW